MDHPNDEPAVICGMTETTAKRYLEIRRKIAIITHRMHQAGSYLNQFEQVADTDLCNALALTGKVLMRNTAQIYHHLENDFASMQTVYEALQALKK